MTELAPDEVLTRDADLASWHAFSLAYYEAIRRVLRLLRISESEIDDLANAFVLKAAETHFLDKYREFQRREEQEGRRARFRTYLYRSLQHHVVDHHRRRTTRSRVRELTPEAADQLVDSAAISALDPDTLYALDILHQALQALRRHCERTGKPHIWTIFEELLLADEFRGRRARTRQELLEMYPGEPPKFLDNSLTTAKRAFRRIIQEVVPRGLRDGMPAAERFDDWMAILSRSSASQFNLLHVAYQVAPHLDTELSQAESLAMRIVDHPGAARYEEPSLLPGDDELSLLLSFRLELPLVDWIESDGLRHLIPPGSDLWPVRRQGSRWIPGATGRPLCLLTLIDPTPAEHAALNRVNLVGLLDRLKSAAKQLRRHPDHAMPEVFAHLLYTVVNLLAATRCQVQLHTIGDEALAGNARWFLDQPWMDVRVRPLLETALK
jgi:DNA-directed RNA polymerase specialized sigma24 family protein